MSTLSTQWTFRKSWVSRKRIRQDSTPISWKHSQKIQTVSPNTNNMDSINSIEILPRYGCCGCNSKTTEKPTFCVYSSQWQQRNYLSATLDILIRRRSISRLSDSICLQTNRPPVNQLLLLTTSKSANVSWWETEEFQKSLLIWPFRKKWQSPCSKVWQENLQNTVLCQLFEGMLISLHYINDHRADSISS